jgi:Tol biopolymer transport system component
VAFVDWRAKSDDEGSSVICIVPVGGGEIRQVSSESDRVAGGAIAFSPDGERIAFFSDGAIKTISVEGGESGMLVAEVKSGRHSQLAYSPDGSKIAHNAMGKIWITRLDGGEPEELQTGLPEGARLSDLDWSRDGEKIAFVGTIGGESEFWLIENFLPDALATKPESATTLRQVETRGRGSIHSRPSYDGKYMSCVDREYGDLVIRELATGTERKLTDKGPWSESTDFAYESLMSPNSTKVAYLWFNSDNEDFDLRVSEFDGSNDRLLWRGEDIGGYFHLDTWSRDGRFVLGRRQQTDDSMQLVRVSPDDGSVEVIKTFDHTSVSKIDGSPESRYVAYDLPKQGSSNRDIFILDLQEHREIPLVAHSANDKLLGWTPDGGHILFASDRNGTWDGWLLRVDDGKPRGLPEMVKAGLGDVSPIGFTQSGAFYYQFWHEGWNVYVAKLDLGTGDVLSEPSPVRLVGKDGWPDWSPDGQYLAYCSEPDDDKPQIIRIRTLTTGQERELKPDLPRFEWLRWCPDNRHLLITAFSWGSPSAVYKLDVETGTYTALVRSDKQRIRQVELSADGKTLVYRIRGNGNANWLIARDMETGKEEELLSIENAMGFMALGAWSLSSNGDEVAFSIREEANEPFALKIMSVATGECRTLDEDQIFQMTWAPDGHDLLVTRKGKELWRVSAEGGEPQKLLGWKEIPIGPRIHPDGQRIAFFSGSKISEMWVMENFLPQAMASTGK